MKTITTYNLTIWNDGQKSFHKGLKFEQILKWIETRGKKVDEYTIVQYENGKARKTTTVKNY